MYVQEQHNEKQSKLSTSEAPGGNSAETEESILQKREYVIRELVETEQDYVRDLSLVAEGYMRLMRDPECDIPMPEGLRGGKDKIVFGNLEAIYEWHREQVFFFSFLLSSLYLYGHNCHVLECYYVIIPGDCK